MNKTLKKPFVKSEHVRQQKKPYRKTLSKVCEQISIESQVTDSRKTVQD